MKYMLLMSYSVPEDIEKAHGEMGTWPPEDIKAHIGFMRTFNDQLTESGELVEAQGLTGPDDAKIVRAGGDGGHVVTDGPFPESKEFLAGYWIVDVDSEQRALEIAAQASAALGRGGVALNLPIEVRQVGTAPDPQL